MTHPPPPHDIAERAEKEYLATDDDKLEIDSYSDYSVQMIKRTAYIKGATAERVNTMGFAEWIYTNDYQCGYGQNDDLWCNVHPHPEKLMTTPQIFYTTAQLFDIFLADKNK